MFSHYKDVRGIRAFVLNDSKQASVPQQGCSYEVNCHYNARTESETTCTRMIVRTSAMTQN